VRLKGRQMKFLPSLEFSLQSWDRLKQATHKRSFWILAAMLACLALLHYLTPQLRFIPLSSHPLGRHAVERIIFILPIASASFAFGRTGGLLALALAVLIMLPRALFISPYPADAFTETAAVALVGYLMIWMIDVQEKEKLLRQEAVLRLRTINAITTIATSSLEPEQIMDGALGKVLEVTKAKTGCIYLLDRETRELILAVCRRSALAESGLEAGTRFRPSMVEPVGSIDSIVPSPSFASGAAEYELGEILNEWVMESGEPILVGDLWQEPDLSTKLTNPVGLRSAMAVPLKSKENVLGFMYLADSQPQRFTAQDMQLLTSISNEVGVAIENAWLHQDVARQLRIEQRLNEVAERITSELELDRILPKVLQIAVELIGVDGGVIAMFDRETNLIRYPYLHNLPGQLAQVTVSKGAGLAGDVMAAGRPLVIKDYANYANAVPEFVEAGVGSLVGVPLISGDHLFGALILVSLQRAEDFSERDVAIMAGIGRQAGIAIENAHLYENMRFYVQQITRAQEDERKRIARELHDDTIQSLIVLSRRLESLKAGDERLPDTVVQRVEELQTQTDAVLKSVRRFSQDLRPSILDDLGLVPTLEGLANALTQQEGIQTELRVVSAKRRLAPESELTLFRIGQEACSNVKRHARATRVWMTIEFTDSAVHLTIQDNGIGFTAPDHAGDLAVSGKLGLIGMYERARLLGGTLAVTSEPGQGTVVTVSIPA
jgi:two-component system sensor histidine kinase DegS